MILNLLKYMGIQLSAISYQLLAFGSGLSSIVTRQLSFVNRHSSLVTRQLSFVNRFSSFVTRQLSFVNRFSSIVTRHLPFLSKQRTAWLSAFNNRFSSLVNRHSSLVTRHSSFLSKQRTARLLALCKILITLHLSLITIEGAFAQTTDNYPVTTTAYFMAPFSQRLSDYFTSDKRLSVDLLLKDLTKSNIQVYLKWSIEGAGIRIHSREGYIPPSFISLQRGVVSRLHGNDLMANYYTQDAIETEGIDLNTIYNVEIPEGFYTLKVTAIEASTGQVVSNTAENYMVLSYPQPPILNLPFVGSEVAVSSLQKIPFLWSPRHFTTPNSQIVYKLKVCEVPDDMEPNEQIMLTCTEPRLDVTVPSTSYNGDITQYIRPLEAGKRYAVQVTVQDLSGELNNFGNQGRSEVSWFRYGKECMPPKLSIKSIGSDRVQLSWERVNEALSYQVEYMATPTIPGNISTNTGVIWQQLRVTGTSCVIPNLNNKTTYLFRIRSDCGGLNPSAPSEEISWNIAEESDEPVEELPIVLTKPWDIDVESNGDGPLLISDLSKLYQNYPTKTPVSISPVTSSGAVNLTTNSTALAPPSGAGGALIIPLCALNSSSFEGCSPTHPTVTPPTGVEELTSLAIGDALGIYDYAVFVTQVSTPPTGGLGGLGLMKLPFMGDAMALVEFSGVKAKKGEAPSNGGCVYEVGGYFKVKNATQQEVTAALDQLIQNRLNQTDTSAFKSTLAQALTKYDQTTKWIGAYPTPPNGAASLSIRYTAAILQGSDVLKTQFETTYGPLLTGSNPNPIAVGIRDSLNKYMALLTDYQAQIKAGTLPLPNIPDIKAKYDAIFAQLQLLQTVPIVTPPINQTYNIKNVRITSVGYTDASLTWQGEGPITSYVFRYILPNGKEVSETVSSPKIKLTKLNEGTDYEFSIDAYNGTKKVTSYGPSIFSTNFNTVLKPQNVNYNIISNTSVKLTWDKQPNYLRYKVIYTDKDGNERVFYPTTNAVTIDGLDPTQSYQYKVIAYDKDNNESITASGRLATVVKPLISVDRPTACPNEMVTLKVNCPTGYDPEWIWYENGEDRKTLKAKKVEAEGKMKYSVRCVGATESSDEEDINITLKSECFCKDTPRTDKTGIVLNTGTLTPGGNTVIGGDLKSYYEVFRTGTNSGLVQCSKYELVNVGEPRGTDNCTESTEENVRPPKTYCCGPKSLDGPIGGYEKDSDSPFNHYYTGGGMIKANDPNATTDQWIIDVMNWIKGLFKCRKKKTYGVDPPPNYNSHATECYAARIADVAPRFGCFKTTIGDYSYVLGVRSYEGFDCAPLSPDNLDNPDGLGSDDYQVNALDNYIINQYHTQFWDAVVDVEPSTTSIAYAADKYFKTKGTPSGASAFHAFWTLLQAKINASPTFAGINLQIPQSAEKAYNSLLHDKQNKELNAAAMLAFTMQASGLPKNISQIDAQQAMIAIFEEIYKDMECEVLASFEALSPELQGEVWTTLKDDPTLTFSQAVDKVFKKDCDALPPPVLNDGLTTGRIAYVIDPNRYFIAPDGRAIKLPDGAKPMFFTFEFPWAEPSEGTLQGFETADGKIYFAEILPGSQEFVGFRLTKPSCPKKYYSGNDLYIVTPSGNVSVYYLKHTKDTDKNICGIDWVEGEYTFAPTPGVAIDLAPIDGNVTIKTIFKECPDPITAYLNSSGLMSWLKRKGMGKAEIYLANCDGSGKLKKVTSGGIVEPTNLTAAQAKAKVQSKNYDTDFAIYGCLGADGKWTIAHSFKNGALAVPSGYTGTVAEVEQKSDDAAQKVIDNNGVKGQNIDDELQYEDLDIIKALVVVKDATMTLCNEAKVPEKFWDDKNADYAQAPFHGPTLSGVGDGAISELKDIPELVGFGLEIATDPTKAKATWNGIKSMTPAKVKKMLLGAATDKLAKYTAGGNTMKHEAGKDGVQVAMFVFGGVTKIKDGADLVDDLGTEVVEKLDDVADEALTKIDDAIDADAGKSINKMVKEGTPPNFLEYESQTLNIAKNKKGSKLSQAETEQLIAREKAFVEDGNLGEIAGSSSTLPDGTLEYTKGTKGGWNKELNKPLKTNSKYKIGKNTYETDAQGRVTNAKGELDLNTAERNGYQQRKGVTSKEGDVTTDQGGHLIAAIFNGAGEQINYVPMLQTLNQGAWKSMENAWKTALDAGKKVEVDIKIIYEGTSKRPKSFKVDSWLAGIKQDPFIFDN